MARLPNSQIFTFGEDAGHSIFDNFLTTVDDVTT